MAGGWSDERREIAYDEARAVIEAQNATITDVDDKAMRTVRLNAVLLGLLVTGLQFAPGVFHVATLQAAFALPVGSSVCGVVTYSESSLYVGPRGRYVEELAEDDFLGSWETDLLGTMAGMIAENRDVVGSNAAWLTATQVALIFGIAAAGASVVI